jgi:hypothetical protein
VLDRADAVLDQLMSAVRGEDSEYILDLAPLDAALSGIEDHNRSASAPVQVLLTLVAGPPRFILEAPSANVLRWMGRPYTFDSLWVRYLRLHELIHRELVRRYVVARPDAGLVALEIVNEPDYLWIPEEMKIETCGHPLLGPNWKYVTELHIPSVPASDRPSPPFEMLPFGGMDHDAAWCDYVPPDPPAPVLDFDWGKKFDWYVRCFGQMQANVSRAIKEEARDRGVEIITVAGSVTHNNIDYLVRVRRAEPEAFTWIDKIGIHPYHWVENNVWMDDFVSDGGREPWSRVDPRRYAEDYFKRFDFLEAFRAKTGSRGLDKELRATFAHRALWITEFGIGSKVLGAFNAPVADRTRFIRPRAEVGAGGGYPDRVWDDLWAAFLDQVSASWLRERGVECILLYALRASATAGFDINDDDRSNLALCRNDGTPRLEAAEMNRLMALLQSMRGSGHEAPAAAPPSPAAELALRHWRTAELPDTCEQVMTMLSHEERQLLYWLTCAYFRGEGAIVDGGCFVGGSTVAFGEGLRAAGRHATIDVYDMFEVEPYMTEWYFKDADLQAGGSFRPMFEDNTRHLADLLHVHEGDLSTIGWRGDPIEILFVDFSKTWGLNDFIVENFFPSLIPGRSVVVQQDCVYAGCPWVILTMEQLEEYFQPVAFAEYNTVVYLCTKAVPRGLPPISELGFDRRMELCDQSIARYHGYPRDVLECAKATLMLEHGERAAATAILDRIEAANGDHVAVRATLDLVRAVG